MSYLFNWIHLCWLKVLIYLRKKCANQRLLNGSLCLILSILFRIWIIIQASTYIFLQAEWLSGQSKVHDVRVFRESFIIMYTLLAWSCALLRSFIIEIIYFRVIQGKKIWNADQSWITWFSRLILSWMITHALPIINNSKEEKLPLTVGILFRDAMNPRRNSAKNDYSLMRFY